MYKVSLYHLPEFSPYTTKYKENAFCVTESEEYYPARQDQRSFRDQILFLAWKHQWRLFECIKEGKKQSGENGGRNLA